MMEETINLLEEIDSLSKIHTLKREDIDDLMVEFAKRILATFRIERMSVWLFNPEKDAIVSMGEYDLPQRKFSKGNTLLKSKYPNYFKAISENEMLLVENIHTNKHTADLDEDYSIPNNLISLMDIPLRVEGELVGIMCFEKTGTKERVFTHNEQVFAFSTSIVFASNLEARYRRAAQYKLNHELKEKSLLVKEIHHRVKNNLAVVSSLLNLQSHKAKDEFHKLLFSECHNKINSIAEIHRMVYKSKSLSKIDPKEYFPELLDSLHAFYLGNDRRIKLKYEIDDFPLEIGDALPVSLIANEIVSNSYKHAFNTRKEGEILFSLKSKGDQVELTIEDNGLGFEKGNGKTDSLGIEIVEGLVEQLNGKHIYKSAPEKGSFFSLSFKSSKLEVD